jgi:hypothetical protein
LYKTSTFDAAGKSPTVAIARRPEPMRGARYELTLPPRSVLDEAKQKPTNARRRSRIELTRTGLESVKIVQKTPLSTLSPMIQSEIGMESHGQLPWLSGTAMTDRVRASMVESTLASISCTRERVFFERRAIAF